MVQDNFGVVADLNARALHIAELSGKSNRQLGKYPACSAARRTARPCVHVRAPYYPSIFLPSFISSRAAGNIRWPPMCDKDRSNKTSVTASTTAAAKFK